jgi:hypothetical protein
MTTTKSERSEEPRRPKKRLIAIGKRTNGKWQVRTSLWRYLAATALSNQ